METVCPFSRAESLASEIRDLQGELGDYNTVSLHLIGKILSGKKTKSFKNLNLLNDFT